MSPTVEFPSGSKDVADSYRDDHPDYICPDDDRRLLTVTFTSDAPEWLLEQARRDAADARGELEDSAGQVGLTDHEKDDIDFSKDRANVPHARAVKGIAASEGVDDWLAHYDPTLTVDEHREVMQRAAREGGGKRMDNEDSAAEKAGQAARTAQSEQCDHAEGHCENGEPEACEFLQRTCGYTDEQVQMILGQEPDADTEQETLTGKQAGAYSRALSGYKGALASLRELVDAVRQERRNAEQAWAAMAGIRENNGQPTEDPEQLHELLDTLAGIPDEHRLSTLHEHMSDGDDVDVIEMDDQRDLSGDRANDQARLAGGEQGERGQGAVEETTEENPGGIMADERDSTDSETETTQQKPDVFRVAEGGQHTL